MRLTGMFIVIIIISFTSRYYAQSYIVSAAIFVGSNYAESPVQSGLPEIEPGKKYPLEIKNAAYAWLNPVCGFEQIYFIKGLNRENKKVYRILTVSPYRGSSLNPVIVTSSSNGEIFGYSVISTMQENAFSFPIKLNYSEQDGILKYIWPSNLNRNSGKGRNEYYSDYKIGQ